jgi:hypothetical protein
MKFILVAAGIVHLIFAALVSLWPALIFEWVGAGQLVHALLCRGLGLLCRPLFAAAKSIHTPAHQARLLTNHNDRASGKFGPLRRIG